VPVAAEGSLAERVAPTISDLDYVIANSKKNSSESKQAAAYKAYLEAAAKASPARQKANQKATDAKIAAANKFLYDQGNLSKAEVAANEKAFLENHKEMKNLDQAREHPLFKRASALVDTLKASQDANAHRMLQLLPNIWLLGDPQAESVLKIMEDATALMAGGTSTAVSAKIDAAEQLYNREQAYMKRMLTEYVLPIGRSAMAYSSHMPTWEEMVAAERKLKAKSGSIAIRSNGKRNGRADVEAAMKARVDEAEKLLKAGKVSFAAVTNLYDAVVMDERTTHMLADMWEYTKTHGLDTLDKAKAINLWQQYGKSAITVVDAKFDPYKQMSREQRQAIVAMHLGKSDLKGMSPAAIAKAEREIITALSYSFQYRYADSLFSVYQGLIALPALSTDTTLRGIAAVRSFRPVAEVDYSMYITGQVEVDGAMTPLQSKDLQAAKRLELARSILTRSIDAAVESGLPKTDPMIVTANAWLTATADASKVAPERIPAVSDMVYGMAVSMASVREAELWASEGGKVLRPNSTTPAAIAEAKRQVTMARSVFRMNFSGANANPDLQVLPAYHYNMATVLGDGVVNSLAPRSFSMTDRNDRFGVLAGNASPDMFGVTVAEQGNATSQEQRQGAVMVERMHLSFLASVKDNANYAVSATDATFRSASVFGPFSALDPRVSRSTPATTAVSGFPILSVELPRQRLSLGPVDIHTVPAGNKQLMAASNKAHENMAFHQWGALYVEGYRITMLHADGSAPEILRALDKAPNDFTNAQQKAQMVAIATRLGMDPSKPFLAQWRAKMLEASNQYATVSADAAGAAKQQANVNDLFLGILDARISELRTLTSGTVEIAGGKKVPVADLARYKDPRGAYAKNALEILAMLDGPSGVRAQLASGKGTDLLGKPMTPRNAIALSEMGMASMDPSNFKNIKYEDLKPPIASEPVDYVPTVRSEQIWVSGVRYGKFTADITAYVGKDADLAKRQKLTMDDYATKRGSPVPIEYAWIGYETFPGDVTMVANPNRANPNWDGTGGAFVGRVLRNIRLPDGSTGDAVVRVEKRSERSGSDYSSAMDYDAVKINGQYDVLYVLNKPVGGQPSFMPVSVDDRARRLCMKTQGRTFSFPSGAEPSAIVLPLVRE
jgi:hypothetical protein